MKGWKEMPYKKTLAARRLEIADNQLSPSYWAEIGKELIDKEYPHLHNVEDVCLRLGISAGHFRDVFRMAYGITPKLYLVRVKVERAMELLKDRLVMVYDVAMKVGIPHRNVFEKTFKKFVGVTPSEYRRLSSSGEFEARK